MEEGEGWVSDHRVINSFRLGAFLAPPLLVHSTHFHCFFPLTQARVALVRLLEGTEDVGKMQGEVRDS